MENVANDDEFTKMRCWSKERSGTSVIGNRSLTGIQGQGSEGRSGRQENNC